MYLLSEKCEQNEQRFLPHFCEICLLDWKILIEKNNWQTLLDKADGL